MENQADDFHLYGTAARQPDSRTIVAGALSVTLQDGNLGAIRFRGHEVLRGVAFLVRDRDWGTCAAVLHDLSVTEHHDSVQIRYDARYTSPSGPRLDCSMRISVTDGRRLSFEADCVSDGDFETARTGFVVLHPIVGVAGQPVTIENGDGTIQQARWPQLIEPWQPFLEIAAITHPVADGIVAETRLAGDVFEMEDQRNWTDASYKTYVRPLARPWPYLIETGKAFSQQVTVEIRADENARDAAAGGETIRLTISPTEILLPDIGIGLRSELLQQERAALPVLKEIGAKHLLAHFDPGAGDGVVGLEGFAEIACQSGLPLTLELAVACAGPVEDELRDIAELVDRAGLVLDSLFVSPSVDRQSTPPGSPWPACPPLLDIYAAARASFPGLRLGGGMMSYFTELNRKRVPGDRIDYVSHATCPIVHAADDLSVMQSFEALGDVLKSMRALYGDTPYRIGPSTIAMRQNPYGSATKDNPHLGRLPMAHVDPRHNGRFGAAWTLAYAATVATAGLEVLTLSTLAGSFGLAAGPDEPSRAGELRPLAHVIAALAAMSGQNLARVESSDPSAVLGLGTKDRLLLANITSQVQRIELGSKPASVELLGDGFQPQEAASLLELGPYGCARIFL